MRAVGEQSGPLPWLIRFTYPGERKYEQAWREHLYWEMFVQARTMGPIQAAQQPLIRGGRDTSAISVGASYSRLAVAMRPQQFGKCRCPRLRACRRYSYRLSQCQEGERHQQAWKEHNISCQLPHVAGSPSILTCLSKRVDERAWRDHLSWFNVRTMGPIQAASKSFRGPFDGARFPNLGKARIATP